MCPYKRELEQQEQKFTSSLDAINAGNAEETFQFGHVDVSKIGHFTTTASLVFIALNIQIQN